MIGSDEAAERLAGFRRAVDRALDADAG